MLLPVPRATLWSARDEPPKRPLRVPTRTLARSSDGELYRTPRLCTAYPCIWDRVAVGCLVRRLCLVVVDAAIGLPYMPALRYLSTVPGATIPADNPACAALPPASSHLVSVRISYLLRSLISPIRCCLAYGACRPD